MLALQTLGTPFRSVSAAELRVPVRWQGHPELVGRCAVPGTSAEPRGGQLRPGCSCSTPASHREMPTCSWHQALQETLDCFYFVAKLKMLCLDNGTRTGGGRQLGSCWRRAWNIPCLEKSLCELRDSKEKDVRSVAKEMLGVFTN